MTLKANSVLILITCFRIIYECFDRNVERTDFFSNLLANKAQENEKAWKQRIIQRSK